MALARLAPLTAILALPKPHTGTVPEAIADAVDAAGAALQSRGIGAGAAPTVRSRAGRSPRASPDLWWCRGDCPVEKVSIDCRYDFDLNAVGASLKRKVFCVGGLADQGAGHPDFGLYAAKQVQKSVPREGQTPERGERFFRSTLVQTLFYGVFSAWVLWARQLPPPGGGFDWRTAVWHLRAPVLRALFHPSLTPHRYGTRISVGRTVPCESSREDPCH